MRKNLLSRLILGTLLLLVIMLIALPFALRRFSSRLPKLSTPSIGDNMTVTPTTNEISPTVFVNNGRKINLKPVGKQTGDGEITITKGDGRWDIGVNTTLPVLNDAFYGIWLIRTAKPSSKVFLGALTDNKGGWGADYTSTTDLSAYQEVWITIQTNTKTPGTKLLIGNL